MWMLGHLTTGSGEPDTRLALIIRGFGLGFLFTPINFIVYASLKPDHGPAGVGLDQSGPPARRKSFGIAVLNTYIYNQAAYHRANLVSYLNAGNPSSPRASPGRRPKSNSAWHEPRRRPDRRAANLLNGRVTAQALTMSYNDAFLLLGRDVRPRHPCRVPAGPGQEIPRRRRGRALGTHPARSSPTLPKREGGLGRGQRGVPGGRLALLS